MPVFMSVQIGVPCKQTSDGKQFILKNFETIQDSPASMYNSALPLCPPSSWLYECYSTEFSQNIRVVVGLTEWGMWTRTVSSCDYNIALACWNSTIGHSSYKDIIIINALTGSQTAVFSGHTAPVLSLAFSSDGTLLVSGSWDETVKLWDVQTGGVVRSLYGHTNQVTSVSISADDTMIASGSWDTVIRLWNVETGSCLVAIEQGEYTPTVTFSPTDSQLLLSSCGNIVKQWSIDGHQIGSPIPGDGIAFSPDGTQFVSHEETTVTIRNTNSRIVVAEFNLAKDVDCCCFSPDGRFIAAAATGGTIYLWDITNSGPCLIQTLTENTADINSLVFLSSLTLVSASGDQSIKFWQIGGSSADPATESTPLTPAPIKAVSLQAKDGLAFSLDSEGAVKTWDILTGCCKGTYTPPVKEIHHGDIQLIGDRLIVVWSECGEKGIHVWDAGEGRLQKIDAPEYCRGLRITGDGSRVLQLTKEYIQAWSIWTGESAGMERLGKVSYPSFDPLCIDGSKVLVRSQESSTVWDFGAPGSTPTQSFETSSYRPHLDFIGEIRVEDSATRREVFCLRGRYADPSATQWDGQYLIAGYESGEVFILDFSHALV